MEIELAEVIDELRAEIDRARKAAQGQELQFALGPVELEVAVCLEKKRDIKGGVNFWVILGGEEGSTNSSAQRIKLTLQPTLHSDNGGSSEQDVHNLTQKWDDFHSAWKTVYLERNGPLPQKAIWAQPGG